MAARRPGWIKIPKAAQALVNSYFEALDMIKADPDNANEIMGAAVKETGKQFWPKSPAICAGRIAMPTKNFFSGEIVSFTNEAARLLTEMKILRKRRISIRCTTRSTLLSHEGPRYE